jgi:hypothetical protein
LQGLAQSIEKWSDRRTAFALFFIFWTTYIFIGPGYSTANSNVVTRMGLVYGILENHTLTIDPFSPFTRDKAEFNGHYYLDKAPGMSLMALASVGVFLSVLHALHISTAPIVADKFTSSYYASVWFVCFVTSALFTALAAVALYFVARDCRASRGAALFGALVFGLATPAAGWATTFFGHATAGACLFIPFALTVLATDVDGLGRRDVAAGLLIGALFAWSVVVEFTSAPTVLVLVGFGLYRLSHLPASGGKKKLLLGGLIGGAIAILPLAIYNAVAFGSVFHIGYQNEVGFNGMNEGLFGISLPSLHVLREIIFGPYRGILWVCPLLIFVPFAYWSAFRKLPSGMALVSLLVPIIYFLINSGYYYWDAGSSTGPRLVTPALPFICLAFVPLWDAAGLVMRAALLTLAGLSGVLSLICASVDMQAPQTFSVPLFQYIIPRFLDGRVHNVLSYGLPDLRSLVALPILWTVVILLSFLLPGFRAAQPSLVPSSRA